MVFDQELGLELVAQPRHTTLKLFSPQPMALWTTGTKKSKIYFLRYDENTQIPQNNMYVYAYKITLPSDIINTRE